MRFFTVLDKCKVNGMMHITGGAFSKLKDILGKTDALIHQPIKLYPQDIFRQLYKKGVPDKTMYSTFNCGIGFILSVPKNEVIRVLRMLKNAAVTGEVVRGNGKVRIESAFSGKMINL